MRPLLILAVLPLLYGCAMGGLVTVSKPRLTPESQTYAVEEKPGIFRIGDLSLSIKPENAHLPLLFVGVVVPVVPLGPGAKIGADKPFQLIIQFQDSEGTHSFAPASFLLATESGPVAPSSIRGPLTRTDFPRELEKASFGHSWTCRDQGRHAMKVEPSLEIKIPPKSCLVLEFVLPTLPPQEQFSVEVGGLKKEGVPLPKIGIQFGPARRLAGSLLAGP